MPCEKYLNGSEKQKEIKQVRESCQKLALQIKKIGPIAQFLPRALSFILTSLEQY
jgi:hypothetical protein